jgi:hypothetical protein
LPDATGLELIAQRVREKLGKEAVTGTLFHRRHATLDVAPASVHDSSRPGDLHLQRAEAPALV